MINRDNINDFLQNKNFVMCISAVFFMFGIFAYFSDTEFLFALILTLILLSLLWFRIFSAKRVILLIIIFYTGFCVTLCKVKNNDNLVSLAPLNSEFYGRIVSIPDNFNTEKVRFFASIEKVGDEKIAGKVLVNLSGDQNELSKLNIGQKIKLQGNLRIPFTSTNPSQFDYSKYLKNYNVFTVIYSDKPFTIYENGNENLKWKFLKNLNTVRNSIIKVHSNYLKSPNLEILGGIVFGDDAVSPPEYIKNSFIHSGLLHILAASGMNVAFIFMFWTYILKFFKIHYRIRIISGMLMIILYTLMTGLGASVVRASLMLLFVLAGKLIDRDTHSVSLLSFVAVLMLIYNPAYLNDVGFQLSFMVTFGLITSANILSQKLSYIPEQIKMPILIPLVAQIWIIPIQMFYFNTISIYSVISNIICAPFLCVVSFCGFLSSLMAIFSPFLNFLCQIIDKLNNLLLDIIVFVSNTVSNLPHCLIQTSHPKILQLIFYYIMLILITLLLKISKYKQCIVVVFSTILLLLGTSYQPISNNLEIIAFDVKNADSFLIKTPQNKYFMIDTGKAAYNSGNSQAKIIMLKYLKDRGIKNLEGVIVTHFDNDHSGGTSDIILNTKVKNLYLNNTKTDTETAKNIFNNAKSIKQNLIITKNNTTIYEEPNLTIKLLKANITGKDSSNGCSTVTLLKYKNFEMLFMGDAGTESYHQIEQYIPENIEILKVGHHGGPRVVDVDMLNHLSNKVSLISTGPNSFGHPNKGTLDLLRNTKILRTDYLNSILILTNGLNYKIYSYDTKDKNYKIKENLTAK